MTAADGAEGIPIDPMWAEGYMVIDGMWRRVFSLAPDAIPIESGTQVQAPRGSGRLVAGRAQGFAIALSRRAEKGRIEFESVTIRDFLVSNPLYLRGQLVSYGGRPWRVVHVDGAVIRLERRFRRRRDADAGAIVDENLQHLISRVVLLVDVG